MMRGGTNSKNEGGRSDREGQIEQTNSRKPLKSVSAMSDIFYFFKLVSFRDMEQQGSFNMHRVILCVL